MGCCKSTVSDGSDTWDPSTDKKSGVEAAKGTGVIEQHGGSSSSSAVPATKDAQGHVISLCPSKPNLDASLRRFGVCRAFGIWADGASESFQPPEALGSYQTPENADAALVHKVLCRIFKVHLPKEGCENSVTSLAPTEVTNSATQSTGPHGSHASRLLVDNQNAVPARSKSPAPIRTDALPGLAKELAQRNGNESTSELLIDGEYVDRLLHERLSLFDSTEGAQAVSYLVDCFARAEDYSNASATQHVLDYRNILGQIIDFSFLMADADSAAALDVPSMNLSVQLQALITGRQSNFISRFCTRVEAEDGGRCLDENLKAFIADTFMRMEGRHMGELKSDPAQDFIRLACGSGGKAVTRALVRSNIFLPDSCEVSLESTSIMGRFMSLSPLDFHLGPRSVRARMLSPPCGLVKEPLPALQRRVEELRLPLTNMHADAKAVSLACLKASKFARQKTLAWLSRVVDQAEMCAATVAEASLLERFGGNSIEDVMASASCAGTSPVLAVNTFWVIADLCEPISLKESGVDLLYRLRHSECSVTSCLLGPYSSAVSVVSEESLDRGREKMMAIQVTKCAGDSDEKSFGAPNFKTEIFWLACRAFSILLRPSLLQAKGALERVSQYQERIEAAGVASSPLRGIFEALVSQELGTALCFEIVLMSPVFQLSLLHFIALVMTFVGDAAADSSEVLGVFPAVLLRHVAEVAIFMSMYMKACLSTRGKNGSKPNGNMVFSGGGDLQPGVVSNFCVVCMGSGRELALRIAGMSLLHVLIEDVGIQALRNNPAASEALLSSVAEVYVDVGSEERQSQLQQRIPVLRLLSAMLSDRICAEAVKVSVPSLGSKFGAFISLLLKDMMSFLEDGLDHLAKLRERLQPQSLDGQAPETMDEFALEQEVQFTKASLELGQMSLSVLRSLSSLLGGGRVLDSSQAIPSQLVVALNCMADRLAGRKALELKVANMATYGFDPKKLLSDIVRIYLIMNDDEVSKSFGVKVAAEERYFRPEVFQKIVRIASRQHDNSILSPQELTDFREFVSQVCKHHLAVSAEAELYRDAPEEFLDGMLYELMEDPVKLPASGVVMDRSNITRHLLVSPEDPFTRIPLKQGDLIPLPDLKSRINEWKTQRQAGA